MTIIDYSSEGMGVVAGGMDSRQVYSIKGGRGDDTLSGNAGPDTIQGGKGADVLTGGGGADVFEYASSDGNDTITDYEEEDLIKITSGSITNITTAKNGNVVFKIGSGKITVQDAEDKVIAYEDADGVKRYYPVDFNAKGTAATVTAEYGKETFNVEDFPEYADTLKNIDASAVAHDLTIIANKNANKIIGTEEDDVIDGGAGKDTILAGDGNDSVDGGKGNDSIAGGLGNDKLTGGAGSDVFVYNEGDGNDTILDYSEEDGDKLRFVGITIDAKKISTTNAGSVVFKVGDNKVTLKDAINQKITYIDEAGTHVWTISEELVDGSDVTLKAGYSANEYAAPSNIENIDASAVAHDMNITGNRNANKIIGTAEDDVIDGGAGKDTIIAGDGNDQIIGGKGNDSLSGGAGADVFEYASGDGSDTITDYEEEDRVKITSGSIKSITTTAAGSVVFKVGSGKITLKEAGDKLVSYEDADGVIHYYPVDINSAGTSATLTSDYTKDTFATTDLKEYADTLKNIDASAVESSLTITGNKKANKIIGTGQDDAIDGGAGADSITGGAGDDTLTGGSGKDLFIFGADSGKDIITDFTTSDKIQIVGGTSDNVTASVAKNGNVIVKHAGGTITVRDAGELSFNLYNDDNQVIAKVTGIAPVVYNPEGTSATLTSYFTDDEFTADSTLVSIDASAVQHALEIEGNKKSNRIIGTAQADEIDGAAGADVINGGKGNDTLTGGKGNDTFVYEKGGGKDIITDIEDGDKIQVVGGTKETVTYTLAQNGNIHINYGSGRITAKDPAAVVTVVDSNDEILYRIDPKAAVNYNEEGTAATLTSYYTANSYGPDDYADYPDLATINASAVNHDLTITGNKKANHITGTEEYDVIYGEAGKDTIYGGDGDDELYGGNDNDKLFGGDGNDTLWGGAGSDSLTGGDGEDYFIYQSGDGKDTILDYQQGIDKIVVLEMKVDNPIAGINGDVTFAVGDSGSIVIQGGSRKTIEVFDGSGNSLKTYVPRE